MTGQRIKSAGVTENWRYSLPGGVVAAALVALGYTETAPDVSLGAVLVVGIVVGFLSKRHYGSSKGTGVLTGLIGALPFLLVLGQLLTATSGLAGPAWFTVAGTVMTVFVGIAVAVMGFGLSALLGELGARVGGALTSSGAPPQTTASQ
ncbi:DUF5518 domain-containing protein [Haloarchaeobius sp. TZWSO28]|uniref:DUF5518 domain-containing protein n=1 Tax=Haloarchaeobius sp. TZWSO28 TaxID=3446119 RepID=UPI003EBEA835